MGGAVEQRAQFAGGHLATPDLLVHQEADRTGGGGSHDQPARWLLAREPDRVGERDSRQRRAVPGHLRPLAVRSRRGVEGVEDRDLRQAPDLPRRPHQHHGLQRAGGRDDDGHPRSEAGLRLQHHAASQRLGRGGNLGQAAAVAGGLARLGGGEPGAEEQSVQVRPVALVAVEGREQPAPDGAGPHRVPIHSPAVVLHHHAQTRLLHRGAQRHSGRGRLAGGYPLRREFHAVLHRVDQQLAQRIGEPVEHQAVRRVVVADQLEADFLAHLARQVAHQLAMSTGDVAQRAGDQVEGLRLEVLQRLLGRRHRGGHPGQAGGGGLGVAQGGGHLVHQAGQGPGIDPQRAHLVDQAEEPGGVHPDVLPERPGVDGAEQTSQVGVLPRRAARGAGARVALVAAVVQGPAQHPHRLGQGRRPDVGIGIDRPRQAGGQALQRLRQSRVHRDLAVVDALPGLLEQLAGVGDGGEAHHAGGALDRVPLPVQVVGQGRVNLARGAGACTGRQSAGSLGDLRAEHHPQLGVVSEGHDLPPIAETAYRRYRRARWVP